MRSSSALAVPIVPRGRPRRPPRGHPRAGVLLARGWAEALRPLGTVPSWLVEADPVEALCRLREALAVCQAMLAWGARELGPAAGAARIDWERVRVLGLLFEVSKDIDRVTAISGSSDRAGGGKAIQVADQAEGVTL